MAKALRGSAKGKREDDDRQPFESEIEEEKRPAPDSITDEEREALKIHKELEDGFGCGSEDGELIGPEDLTSIESEPLTSLSDLVDYTFRFDKSCDGARVNVWVIKFKKDEQGRLVEVDEQRPHPSFGSMKDADEWINGELAKIKVAIEKSEHLKNLRIHQPLKFTPGYGKGVTCASGELVIVATTTGDEIVVIPELVDEIMKWLKGRGVAAHRVSDRGLHLVTEKDFQRATFLYQNKQIIVTHG